MKLRWGKERIKGFSDPIRKAEEVNCWGLFVIVVIMGILFVLKISGKI